MPIDLDQPADVPKHVRLADYIRARIADGTYPPKSRIPSEITFTQETGFARDTVRKAIAILLEENRVYIVKGLGTFVTGPEKLSRDTDRLRNAVGCVAPLFQAVALV